MAILRMHTNTQAPTDANTRIHTLTPSHSRSHTHTHTSMSGWLAPSLHRYTNGDVRPDSLLWLYYECTQTHKHPQTQTHAYTHSHPVTHAHTHTHIPPCRVGLPRRSIGTQTVTCDLTAC